MTDTPDAAAVQAAIPEDYVRAFRREMTHPDVRLKYERDNCLTNVGKAGIAAIVAELEYAEHARQQLAAAKEETESFRRNYVDANLAVIDANIAKDQLAAALARERGLREALLGAKSFIENLKVPQTLSDAAEQVRQGMHRMNGIEAALAEPKP